DVARANGDVNRHFPVEAEVSREAAEVWGSQMLLRQSSDNDVDAVAQRLTERRAYRALALEIARLDRMLAAAGVALARGGGDPPAREQRRGGDDLEQACARCKRRRHIVAPSSARPREDATGARVRGNDGPFVRARLCEEALGCALEAGVDGQLDLCA